MTSDALEEFLADSEVDNVKDRVPTRRIVALALGTTVVVAIGAILLLVVLPVLADVIASLFLFITRLMTGK